MKRTDLRAPALAAMAFVCALLGLWTLRTGDGGRGSSATSASLAPEAEPVRVQVVSERRPVETPVPEAVEVDAVAGPAAESPVVEEVPTPGASPIEGSSNTWTVEVVDGGSPVERGEVRVREQGQLVGEAPIVDGVAVLHRLPLDRSLELDIAFDGAGIVTVERSGPTADGGDSSTRIELDVAGKRRAEESALSVLGSIASAQELLRSSAVIDTDGDGQGEYGYLGELAGSVPCRVYDVTTGARVGSSDDAKLSPALLPAPLGEVVPIKGAGAVYYEGYYFQVHLPTRRAADRAAGVAESASGGSPPTLPDAELAERHFGAYAWPADEHLPAHRAFFVNESGEVVALPNREHTYVGAQRVPAFDAALSSAVKGDMAQPQGSVERGLTAGDGHTWRRVTR